MANYIKQLFKIPEETPVGPKSKRSSSKNNLISMKNITKQSYAKKQLELEERQIIVISINNKYDLIAEEVN